MREREREREIRNDVVVWLALKGQVNYKYGQEDYFEKKKLMDQNENNHTL